MKLSAIRTLATALAAMFAAQAQSAVLYTFTTEGFSSSSQFLFAAASYSSPSYIVAPTVIPASQLATCNAIIQFPAPSPLPCVAMTFTPSAGGDAVFLTWLGGGSTGTFSAGAFTVDGFYVDSLSFSTLTVETTLAAVPEPSTWALMIVGFGVVGGAVRRRGSSRLVGAY